MMGFLREEGLRRYLQALEEERKKIQMFQRELPLCCELVTQAIESYKQQMMCEEETSNNVPVLEEFIPIKRAKSVEEEEGEEESSKDLKSSEDDEKVDWLQSVQLWNQNPDPPKEEAKIGKPIVLEARKVKGAFQPFHRDRKRTASVEQPTPTPTLTPTPKPKPTPAPPPPPPAASSTGDSEGSRRGKEGHSSRKPRRCWSPELHRRFLSALQQLGGSHVATPKQIRELMKVDGLTNDEVKSHLQVCVLLSSHLPSGGLWFLCFSFLLLEAVVLWRIEVDVVESPSLSAEISRRGRRFSCSHARPCISPVTATASAFNSNNWQTLGRKKYRLHTRRPSPSPPASNGGGGGAQAPQLILVGGIWVPSPPDYTATAAAAHPATERPSPPTCGIYAPVASVPAARSKCNVSNSSSNNTGEGDPANSSSPATSSSSLTVTATPRS